MTIKDFLSQPNPDYSAGLALLAQHRPGMARIFGMRKSQNWKKLTYELSKFANKPESPNQKLAVGSQQLANPKPQTKNKEQETRNKKQGTTNKEQETRNKEPEKIILTHHTSAPAVIDEISREHARLVQLRSQLAEQRMQIPQTNTPANNKKRKVLSESIHAISAKIEEYFNAHAHYMKYKTIPQLPTPEPDTSTSSATGEPDTRNKEQKTTNNKQKTLNPKPKTPRTPIPRQPKTRNNKQ